MVKGLNFLKITAILGLLLPSCGYVPAYGGTRPSARLSVVAAPSRVAEGGAFAAVLAGVRQELSRAGVLNSGSEYPRVVVELVRLDERGTGQLEQGNNWALARGTIVGLTARAWVEEKPSEAVRDTGDIRRTSSYDTKPNSTDDLISRDAALESTGRHLGEALARRILGEVEVTQEPM